MYLMHHEKYFIMYLFNVFDALLYKVSQT
jgi:hypothetical protein